MSDSQQDKLDRLSENIDEVRRDAEEHGTIPPTDEQTLAERDGDAEEQGSTPPTDEQTLADPDGDGDVDDTPVQPPG